jgi:hypothetical protein
LLFLDYFDMLILKINFKNKKNIILIHFKIKITLKNNYNLITQRKIFVSLFCFLFLLENKVNSEVHDKLKGVGKRWYQFIISFSYWCNVRVENVERRPKCGTISAVGCKSVWISLFFNLSSLLCFLFLFFF